MDVYDLGAVNWWESQCFYHALAYLGREGLVICCPSSPYVCLGLHDDLEQEIDQEFCKGQGIPVFRRETGGGVVYLDQQQVFYQLVLRRDNSRLPLQRTRYYASFLQPAISVYRRLGMPAVINQPADIAAAGRKCSGNACGDIGDGVAYVGNLLLDFDYVTMSRVLLVREEFRKVLLQAMKANMTTIKDWLDHPVSYDHLAAQLKNEYARQWGELRPRKPDGVLTDKSHELYHKFSQPEWLYMPGRRYSERRVKIAEGIILTDGAAQVHKGTTQHKGTVLLCSRSCAAVLIKTGR